MPKINRMTGVAWQVEKHYEVDPYSTSCKNCINYQEEGYMCRKYNIVVSNLSARECEYFKKC